jgi:hypothetical protein
MTAFPFSQRGEAPAEDLSSAATLEAGAHFVGIDMRGPRPRHGCDRAMLDAVSQTIGIGFAPG